MMSGVARLFRIGVLAGLVAIACMASGQTATTVPVQQTARPAPPTRDAHTPGYVTAKELPDGALPAPDVDGNFIIGPTHASAPEMTAQELTHGNVVEFTMNSTDSKLYPGIARDKGTFGNPDPADP